MNLDPQVRDAYHYFYLLDYPAAVQRFERIHQEHPGDPHATTMLLEAVVFQELYRQDLLDTTFYANDGFLTGKHATDEDPKKRDEIFALADQQESKRHRCALRERMGAQSAMHLCCDGAARVWSRVPAGRKGEG